VTAAPRAASPGSGGCRIGIDLGGTKIEGVVLDPSGTEIFRKRIATEREGGYEHILGRIVALYHDLKKNAPDPHTLGIGTPGAVSSKTGFMKNSNTTCLNGRPLAADLRRALGRPLKVENDANCFALAEGLMGAGQGCRTVFGVIMGTGCGGGIMVDGAIWGGLQQVAGEWGHMSIDPSGPACYCGSRGCVETFISGGGLENRFEEEAGVRRSADRIVLDYREGEAAAVRRMGDFFDRFGRAVANLIAVLDPEIIVLGGGLSSIDELYSTGVDAVRRYVFSDSLETPIVRNRLGDSAGVLGAALNGI
jgi:fructokinase